MKFLSPRPQAPKIEKDRLGNTVSSDGKAQFPVELWAASIVLIGAFWSSDWLEKSFHIQNDFSIRVLEILVIVVNFGTLRLLNHGLNRFGWYRDFKRSPLLISGTILIFAGVILFLSWRTLAS